jgi:hypothetical protein
MDHIGELGGYQLISEAGFALNDAFNFASKQVHLLALGRHCLEVVYRSLRPEKVILPHYTCHSVKSLFQRLGSEVEYYSLGKGFMPKMSPPGRRDLCVVNNYFGLAASDPRWLSWLRQFEHAWVVVDDTQSLSVDGQFEKYCSFISPRKFLPVTDGGILFAAAEFINHSVLPDAIDASWGRVQWLFRAVDEEDRQQSYAEYLRYRKHEIQNIPYSRMSRVTRLLLQSYDVKSIINQRNSVFDKLKQMLPVHPLFEQAGSRLNACPIGFPVRVDNAVKAQSVLAVNRLYAVMFWPELYDAQDLNSFERELACHTIFLPLEDKYSPAHVSAILGEIS